MQRKVTFELAAAVKDESSLGLICRKGFNPDFSSLSHLHHFFSHLFPNFYFKISIYPTYKIPDSKFSPGPVLRFLRSAWLVLFLLLLLSSPPLFIITIIILFIIIFLHFLDPPSSLESCEVSGSPWFRGKPYSCIKGSRNRSNFIFKTHRDEENMNYLERAAISAKYCGTVAQMCLIK